MKELLNDLIKDLEVDLQRPTYHYYLWNIWLVSLRNKSVYSNSI